MTADSGIMKMRPTKKQLFSVDVKYGPNILTFIEISARSAQEACFQVKEGLKINAKVSTINKKDKK